MDMSHQSAESNTLSKSSHLYAAWPLLFVPFCGVVGLAYFALAYVINIKVLSSPLSKMNKVLATIMSGMCALSGWWFTAQWLQTL